MDLFAPLSTASSLALTDKYRPTRVADFVGLDKPRKLLAKIAANPPRSTNGGCYLFTGGPGVGKTSAAMALASDMAAELQHIPSQDCNLDVLRRTVERCYYMPKQGCTRHIILIDEADQMSAAAQLYLLSKMDATGALPDTLIIFTANETERLHDRFLSRCLHIPFSAHGESKQIAAFCERVWDAEAPANAVRPNFVRLVKEACNNVRAALMALQTELLLVD